MSLLLTSFFGGPRSRGREKAPSFINQGGEVGILKTGKSAVQKKRGQVVEKGGCSGKFRAPNESNHEAICQEGRRKTDKRNIAFSAPSRRRYM